MGIRHRREPPYSYAVADKMMWNDIFAWKLIRDPVAMSRYMVRAHNYRSWLEDIRGIKRLCKYSRRLVRWYLVACFWPLLMSVCNVLAGGAWWYTPMSLWDAIRLVVTGY